ncbi:helix-turn-helix domain-containing protein [Pseudonocardia hydrocarbonoxydans]|uniref:HTH cro/C1-type domain-containing protein n=1 Tax=Pseudonocardia hydrocarbonoxydans TaxID=76726 RepID=A0A4Y3WVK3_9PSEU|nr:hypothetical protein PHY01_52080 [Pseudonocardia hydrocarbonoxydans]
MNAPPDEQIDNFYSAVGRRVKVARTSANMTQLELSKQTGLTRSSIANLEAGRQRVQIHVLALIAGCLSIDPSDLIADTFAVSRQGLPSPVNDDLERYSTTARSFVEAGLRTSRISESKESA